MTERKYLDKYEILKEIGRGGFAVVYEARDTELGRVVALKLLHPQLTTDPKFIQRFHQEAWTAAGLHHPHIVTIHEVGEEAGQHYLAMAFLPGRTLDTSFGIRTGETHTRNAPPSVNVLESAFLKTGSLRQAQGRLPDSGPKRGFDNPLGAILDLPSLPIDDDGVLFLFVNLNLNLN